MKRSRWTSLVSLALLLAMLAGLTLPVRGVGPWFYDTYTDWHFNLANEPDRAMTVEEFIALTTAYSYWSPGADGESPRDRDGNLPSDWAAPFIRCEANKGVIKPEELDYDAPATLAFAMKFIANSKGLYGFNAVNLREFSGTEGLTVEERLCLNTAVDYGIVPYTENMDVSVALPRRDLEAKYMIPQGVLQPVCSKIVSSPTFPHSMIFFEDCNAQFDKSQRQVDYIKANRDSFDMVTLDAIYFTRPKAIRMGKEFVGDFIRHPYGDVDPQTELVEYCRESGLTLLGGVTNWYDDSCMRLIRDDEAAMNRAVNELIYVVKKHDLDGLNIDIELYGNEFQDTYSTLVRKVSERLHKMDKILVLTVGGRMWQEDIDQGLYDYDVVNEVADLVTVITYDIFSALNYTYGGGSVGAMSNFTYTDRCIRYAAEKFGRERVLLGVGGYAICYNTTDHTAENISIPEARALMAKHNAAAKTHGGEVDDCYFEFRENGKSYVVYMESDAGLLRRIDLATCYGLGGIGGFHIGGEYQLMFDTMGRYHSSISFDDVSPDAWYFDSVEYACENGLFNGMSDSSFEPETAITRAMVVTVLWRLDGETPPIGENPFTDVRNDFWYTDAIVWAAENGIVNGVGKGKFEPDEELTREQLATVLYRYAAMSGIDTSARISLERFPDSSAVNDWAWEALAWACAVSLISGSQEGGTAWLLPAGEATRAQTATILMRYLENIIGNA